MKLHLPITLLAAVLSTFAYAVEADITYSEQPYTGTIGAVTGVTGANSTSVNPNEQVINTNVTIGLTDGTETSVESVYGVGHQGYIANGDKTITIQGSNTYAGYVRGGTYYANSQNSHYGSYGEGYNGDVSYNFAPKAVEGAKITINVIDGARTTAIFAGNGAVSGKYAWLTSEINAAKNHFTSEYVNQGYTGDQLTEAVNKSMQEYLKNPAWAITEDIEININNGVVGVAPIWRPEDRDTNPDLIYPYASIQGAGYGGFSTSGNVTLKISGDESQVFSNVYAGAAGRTQDGTDLNAYVGSTNIEMSGGVAYSNLFAGGSGTAGSNTVRGNSEIVLSGGTVKGSVYAGGRGNTYIGGDTKVTLKGTGTEVGGVISGLGLADDSGTTNVSNTSKQILAFDSYTGFADADGKYNTDADGYTIIDMEALKVKDFNAIEVTDSQLNFGTEITNQYTSLSLNGSSVKAESLRGGEAIKLTGSTHLYLDDADFSKNKAVAPSLVVNDAVKLAAGSDYTGSPEYGFLNLPAATATLTAHSVTTEGAVNFAEAEVTATTGKIEIAAGSTLSNTNLIAKKGTVKLTDSTMNGGDIVAQNLINSGSNIEVDSLSVSGQWNNTGDLTVRGNADVYYLRPYSGTVEFAGGQGTKADIKMLSVQSDAQLVHSGAGTLEIGSLYNTNGATFTMTQSGEGTLTLKAPATYQDDPIVLNQTGKGNINIKAGINLAELNISGGGKVSNQGNTTINKVVSSGNGGTIYNMDKNMTVNEATGNGTFYQNGTGTLTFTGNADMMFLNHSAGKVEFAGGVDTTANINLALQGLGGGQLVHSGDGILNMGMLNFTNQETYTITQSGNGILNMKANFVNQPTPVVLNQTGAGEINIKGGAKLSELNMTGGGTVSVSNPKIEANINTILVFNGSTLENSGNLTSKNVSISQSTVNNSGTMKVDNFAIADGEDATSSITNSGKGNMALGEVDCTVANATFKQEGTGTMTFGGNVTNRDFGAFDASLNLSQSAGKVDFAGKEGTTATFNQVQASGGELVHSGNGTVNVESGMVSGDYSIKQTGNGTMNIGDGETPGGIVQFGGTTTITQEGTGTIANYGASGAWFGEFNLTQTGGGTVENWGTLTLNDVSVTNDSTLLNAGELWILDELAIENATLAFVVNDVMGDTGAALTLDSSASITALDNVAFHVIFDNEEVYAQKGVNYGLVEFSVTVMEGLTNLTDAESLAEIDSLVAAMDAGSLTLSTLDENGNEVAMKVNSAGLTLAEDGSVVLSGTMIIPEPTTATLSLLALAALAARRRRK